LNFDEKHIALFDRYLNENNKEFNKKFEARLESEPELKTAFEDYKFFIDAIKTSFDYELKTNIIEGERKFKKIQLIKKIIGIGTILFAIFTSVIIINNEKSTTIKLKAIPDTLAVQVTPKDSVALVQATKTPYETPLPDSSEKQQKTDNKTQKTVRFTSDTTNTKEVNKMVALYNISSYDKLEMTQTGNEVVLKSPEEVVDLMSFLLDNNEFIKLNGTIYQNKNNIYNKATNQKIGETISRSSGRAKQITCNIYYYKVEFSDSIAYNNLPEEFIINDKIYQFDGKEFIPAALVEKYQSSNKKTIIQRYFTVEDIFNLESNQ